MPEEMSFTAPGSRFRVIAGLRGTAFSFMTLS